MRFNLPLRTLGLTLLLLLGLAATVQAHAGHHHHSHANQAHLNDLYGEPRPACSCPTPTAATHLSSCDFVTKLSAEKLASREGGTHDHGHPQGQRQRALFNLLFPFENPGLNALASTFYISSVPNLLLWFVPADINPDTLNTMVAFATGGLLGDVFLHLLPATFLSLTDNVDRNSANFIMIEEKRNILLGLAIFFGFATFFVLEKGMRVINGGEGGHSHSHSHGHAHDVSAQEKVKEEVVEGAASSTEKRVLRKRKSNSTLIVLDGNGEEVDLDSDSSVAASEEVHPEKEAPINLSAYLNLFADAAHNMTDGLAIAASFYASNSIGATTTVAVFFHEIPHEMADFSILLKSGFSKKKAMISQCFTALGAFAGTLIGIALHSTPAALPSSHTNADQSALLTAAIHNLAGGILGTSVTLSDCVIPFTAGTFLYIASVGVVPQLLSDSKSWRLGGVVQGLREMVAMVIGMGIMFAIAWNE